jgi:hypothetical protein
VRDWDSVAELVSVLPSFGPLIVSRFREFGDSGRVTIQQIAIASRWAAESAWSESFKPSAAAPPRGFSFAAIRRGNTILLVYSAHFKSNRGDPANDIDKREEAARQLLAHTSEMETLYSKGAKVVIVIAGDFNTDPTDPRFASEQTFALLRKTGFLWAWQNIPLSERRKFHNGLVQQPVSFRASPKRNFRVRHRGMWHWRAYSARGIVRQFVTGWPFSVECNRPLVLRESRGVARHF